MMTFAKRRAWRRACTDAAAEEIRAARVSLNGSYPHTDSNEPLHAAKMRARRMLASRHPGDLPGELRKKVELFHTPPPRQDAH
jgi:hypothetical protein